MLSMVEGNGVSKFDALNKDVKAQIKYVYDLIDSYGPEYKNLTAFIAKNFKLPETTTVKEKAELSRSIRDRGNSAYSKKDFEAAIRLFSESALAGNISRIFSRTIEILAVFEFPASFYHVDISAVSKLGGRGGGGG
jgi:hypothetical protein